MAQKRLQARLALGVRDRKLAEERAGQLIELGFSVIRVGSRGVSFEGSIEQFEQTFSSAIKTTQDHAEFAEVPTLPEDLDKDVDSVYFPTRPIFLLEHSGYQ